jgi:hypothetical protein
MLKPAFTSSDPEHSSAVPEIFAVSQVCQAYLKREIRERRSDVILISS